MQVVPSESTAERLKPGRLIRAGKLPAHISFLIFSLVASVSAWGTDHPVPKDISLVDCRVYNGGVAPGDTITLQTGIRGELVVRNCTGTDANPITIRNSSSGQTIVQRSSGTNGGFILHFIDVKDFVVDGTADFVGKNGYCGVDQGGTEGCGIVVTSTNGDPTHFLKMHGTSTEFTIKGVEIRGNWSPGLTYNGSGIGMACHDTVTTSSSTGWREDILIERNYIHGAYGEGLYCGPNWYSANGEALRLRNVEIRHNVTLESGRNGLNLKSAIAGHNSIHSNYISRSGLRTGSDPQSDCITIWEGNADVYDNYLQDCGGNGIGHFRSSKNMTSASWTSNIYNNVVNRTGLTRPDRGKGIAAGGSAPNITITGQIYNNTLVDSREEALSIGGDWRTVTAMNNIIAECGTSPCISLRGGSNIAAHNLVESSKSRVGFVDPSDGNFWLQASSVAVNAGDSRLYPEVDIRGAKRPYGGSPDQGAYEYTGGAVLPAAPALF